MVRWNLEIVSDITCQPWTQISSTGGDKQRIDLLREELGLIQCHEGRLSRQLWRILLKTLVKHIGFRFKSFLNPFKAQMPLFDAIVSAQHMFE